MVFAYHKELGEVIFHEKLSYSTDKDSGFVYKVSKKNDLILIFDDFLEITKEIAIPEKTNEVKFLNLNNQLEKAIRKNLITFKKIESIFIEPKFKSIFSIEKIKKIKNI